MKLYELPPAFSAVELLAGEDGELTAKALDRLTSLEMALADKVEACCRVMRNYEARAAAFKAEADRLAFHGTTAAKNAQRLKEYVKGVMEQLNVPRVDAGLFKVRVQANPPTIKVTDECDIHDLPDQFKRVTIEFDKRAMLDAAKAGDALPAGIEVVRGSHLRVT